MTNTNLSIDLMNLIEQFVLAECGEAEQLTLADCDFLIENEDHSVWFDYDSACCSTFRAIMDFRDYLLSEEA